MAHTAKVPLVVALAALLLAAAGIEAQQLQKAAPGGWACYWGYNTWLRPLDQEFMTFSQKKSAPEHRRFGLLRIESGHVRYVTRVTHLRPIPNSPPPASR